MNILLSVLLARRFGLLGVVLGTMLAQIATNHWYVPWYTMRLFGINAKQHMRRVLLPALYLLIALLLVNGCVRVLTRNVSNLLSVESALVCTLVAGGFCFGTLVLSSEERLAFLRKLRKLGTGIPAMS